MNQKTKNEITGKKAATLDEVKENLSAKIVVLDKIADNAIKRGERKAAKVHADLLRAVLKGIA